MKKLGLVGGMGPESTVPYYHDIVYGVQEKVGGDFFPNLTIESVNVFDVLRLCGEQKYEELTTYLMKAIRNLIQSGADFVALSANTPHIVFDRLKEQTSVPLVSIIDATRDEAQRQNIKRLGLLGTVFTMKGEFFKKPFVEDGIEAVVLGCTELPLLLNDSVSPVPCLDTMQIHIKTLVERIVEEQR